MVDKKTEPWYNNSIETNLMEKFMAAVFDTYQYDYETKTIQDLCLSALEYER